MRRSETGERGWLASNKWLLARRLTQLSILALFLAGPWFGLWLVTGNLTSSMTLDTLPLSDPFILAQSLLAGHAPAVLAITGALIVVVFYLIVSGRVYCAWVCPVNMVTDLANWLRRKLGITGASRLSAHTRYWILGMTLVLAIVTGTLAWELINPVSMLHRGILFGMGAGWLVILAVFLLDLLVTRRAWCGHLCPMGAFYSLLGTHSPLRVRADARDRCDDCMDCYRVCPEPQVIRPALKGESEGLGPVILSPNCTNCGRCIDVCSKRVFRFGTRFDNHAHGAASQASRSERASLSINDSPGMEVPE